MGASVVSYYGCVRYYDSVRYYEYTTRAYANVVKNMRIFLAQASVSSNSRHAQECVRRLRRVRCRYYDCL